MIFFMRKNALLGVCFFLMVGMMMTGIFLVHGEETAADISNSTPVSSRQLEAEFSPKPDFFTEYRIERDQLRSECSELLRESAQSAANDQERQTAQEHILQIAQEKEKEAEMEGLIKAKGFADALVVNCNHSVSAIIKADALTKDEVIQVADIISRVARVRQEEITISAKP